LQPSATDEVTKEVLQPMGTVRFGRAMQLLYAPQAQGNFAMFNQQNRVPTEGPIWFRKMDRNGDGEISRSEFLGMTADFDRIDTDHDGLISRTEAEAVKK